MKARHKILTGLVAVALVAAAMQSPRAYAGDEEWATAGKILTGVVTAHVLVNGLPFEIRRRTPDRHRRGVYHESRKFGRHRSISRWRRHRSYRPRGRCSSRTEIRIYEDFGDGYSSSGHGKSWHGGCGCHRKSGHSLIVLDDAVVVPVDHETRLYQPKVHGHVAFVQKRPFPGHPWTTEKQHPSIW